MKVVLASSSKQRQDILKMIGLKFEVMISDAPEFSEKQKPDEYVKELSLNKALSVSKKINDKTIIIAADTIVYKDGHIYEKPKTKEEAMNNIRELSGGKNTAYTGVTILDKSTGKLVSTSTSTDVYFRNVLEEEIVWYSENESKIFSRCGYVPLGKASIFIERIDGDFNTLLGLSPNVLFNSLKDLGYKVTDFEYEISDPKKSNI